MVSSWAASILRALLATVFGLAAAAKLLDAEPVVGMLRYLFPHSWFTGDRDLMAIGLIAGAEGSIALALVLFARSRALAVVTVALLVLYTAALVVLASDEQAPACACLGSFGSGRRGNIAGIVRNLGLIGAGLCLLGSAGVQGRAPDGVSVAKGMERPRSSPAAFSLVEVLVVIALVAVLAALAIPSFYSARRNAAVIDRLSTLRELARAVTLYADANRDALPYMGTPRDPGAPLRVHGEDVPNSGYFFQAFLHANLLVPDYFADRSRVQSTGYHLGVLESAGPVFVTPFWLTQTAFAAPTYFSAEPAPDDLSLYRPVRTYECRFPSSKLLLLDSKAGAYAGPGDRLYVRSRVLSAQVDGAAAAQQADVTSNSGWSDRPYGAVPFFGMTTHGGIAGRDF